MASKIFDAAYFSSVVEVLERVPEVLLEPLKTELQNVSMKVRFLSAILSVIGKAQFHNDNLQFLLHRANSVLQKVGLEFARLISDFSRLRSVEAWVMPINLDFRVSRMLEGLELLGPDVQEMYTVLSKSPRYNVEITDELFMKRFILQNMEDLVACKGDFVAPIKEEVEAVLKSLKFLGDFLGFNGKRYTNLRKCKDLLILGEVVAMNISCLLFLCLVICKMDDHMLSQMKLELSKQLQKLDPVKSDARKIYIKALKALKSVENPTPVLDEFSLEFLKSLLDNLLEPSVSDPSLSFISSSRNLLLELHQELRFLKDFIGDMPWKLYSTEIDLKFKDLWGHSDALIKEAGYVIYTLYEGQNESIARELNTATSDLLAKITVAKENARNIHSQIVPKSFRTNFPKPGKLVSILFIFHNLRDVLDSQADSVAPVKYHIEAAMKDLVFLLDDFTDGEEYDAQLTCFADILYHTECIVDLFLSDGLNHLWFIKLGLFDVIEEVKIIKQEVKRIKNAEKNEASASGVSSYPVEISSGAASSRDNEGSSLRSNNTSSEKEADSEFVLFEHQEDIIKEQIISGSENLEILSIVGMPGIGKTTLANSVYRHFSRTNYFHVHARCTVTQAYDRKGLFLQLLKDITIEAKEWDKLDEEDLAVKLYRALKNRKYFIFMDDIWNFEPLQDTRASLPDDGNGSRILLTSRVYNIASPSNCRSRICRLSPISDEKAWELLQFKVFASESYIRELAEIGKQLATMCGGLPLLVDVMAGLLLAVEPRKDNWQQVVERVKAAPVDLQERCRQVIELSYSDLPEHLKACFLYFAAFPKGEKISKRKLISIWIAEGFVYLRQDDPRSLEDAALGYLNDLIARNLVTISEGGLLGKIKSSSIHDLLHDFALAKAKDESFLKQIEKYDNSDLPALSPNGRLSVGYRLCFYPAKKDYFLFRLAGPRVRALLFNWPPFHLSFLLSNFKLLRVLDINNIRAANYDGITDLIHLRFLSLHGLEARNLANIHKFRRLETLFLQRAYTDEDNKVLLLEHICSMEKLRHFQLKDSYILEYSSKQVFDKLQLQNLQSLSHPMLCYGELSDKVMERMPNLRKLTCSFLDSWDSARNNNIFPKLELLRKLESLKVTNNGSLGNASYPCKFSFPPYLKKVTLEFFGRPWSEISVLGKLERLEILRLRRKAFAGETWTIRDGEFPKLKCMVLSDLDIEHWIASEDSLPCLEILCVLRCKQLEELPSCLAEKSTLKTIWVSNCSTSFLLSAKQIKEEQVENGNEQFIVLTHEGITEEFSLL